MKRYNNILKRALSIVALVALCVSCDDSIDLDELRNSNYKNKQSTGEPTITAFYEQVDYASNETPTALDEAELSTYIVAVGENLEGVTSLSFNSQEYDLNEIYSQWDMVVFKVPDVIPSDITNKFSCTTSYGTFETELKLALPDIVLSQIENGFILPGEATRILGANFTIYGFDTDRSSVILYNDEQGYEETLSVTFIDVDYIKVNIPSDAPDNSTMKFIVDGEEHEQKFLYRPTNYLLFGDLELENKATVREDVLIYYTDGSASGDPENLIPNGLDGASDPVKFFRIIGTAPSSWYTFIYIKTQTSGSPYDFEYDLVIPDGSSAADYNLVFEVSTASDYPIPVGSTYMIQFPGGGTNGMWDSFGQNAIDTAGEWITYKANLSSFTGTMFGNTTTANCDFAIKSNFGVVADHSFANFRIEPVMPE